MNSFEKNHAGKGVHFLSGTEWSTEGLYYGFVVTGEETVIDDIEYIDDTVNSGDITSITMVQGLYYPIAGNFSKIKLTSGDMMLLKAKI